jgi:hypothetical protein
MAGGAVARICVGVWVTFPVPLGGFRRSLVPRPLPEWEEDKVTIDSAPQPCPQCQRPTVLASYTWGRQWVHVGTWRPQCGAPSWMVPTAENGTQRVPRTA